MRVHVGGELTPGTLGRGIASGASMAAPLGSTRWGDQMVATLRYQEARGIPYMWLPHEVTYMLLHLVLSLVAEIEH